MTALGNGGKSLKLLSGLSLLILLVVAACGSPSYPKTPDGSAIWTATPSAQAAHVVNVPAGDWLQFGFDATRSGVNPFGMTLTPASVGSLHQLWQVKLPGVADSSPALLHNLTLLGGSTRDALYVTTRDGRLLALDAANGMILWSKQPRGPKITHSSPVIDPSGKYVYAYGLDGYLHKYSTTTGDEVISSGWPVRITLMTQTEKESSALNYANGNIYVTTSGYIGDAPPYQGHVVVVNAASGATKVFNSLCSDKHYLLKAHDCNSEQSGIWARGGAVVDPITGNIYATTGNGPYSGYQGGHDWGDSIIELSSDGAQLLDSYTPASQDQLNQYDTDLGSMAPALLPPIPTSKTPFLLIQSGKDAIVRLLNRQNMSGAGKPGYVGGELQSFDSPGCGVFAQPAIWTEPISGTLWVFIAGQCGFGGYQVVTTSSGKTSLHLAWKNSISATTPVLAGGVLYAATSGNLLALDPHTGKQLWSSKQASAGGSIGAIHWESPIVVGGKVYSSDDNGNLTAYGR